MKIRIITLLFMAIGLLFTTQPTMAGTSPPSQEQFIIELESELSPMNCYQVTTPESNQTVPYNSRVCDYPESLATFDRSRFEFNLVNSKLQLHRVGKYSYYKNRQSLANKNLPLHRMRC
jgi:hypothetical protein